ncbi:MAG: N-acetylmuramoyl-L-alanine amidase [Oscillospiraceae bacterium]|nr:N-acetylmuramoyl-L-alanine amidase [Oscillospiraceae bacterium]
MKKLLRGIISAILCLSVLSTTAFASTSEDTSGITQTGGAEVPETTQTDPVKAESKIYLQDDMRAVFLTPNVDFDGEADLASLCTDIIGLGMNAVVINSTGENEDFYDFELDKTDGVLNDMLKAAHGANLCAYLTLDVNSLVKKVLESGGGLKEGFTAAVHKFAMKYSCEGVILVNYYTENTPEMYAEYLRSGSGIGYENWLYETNRYIIRTVSEAVRKTSNTTAVGIFMEDMWANASAKEGGSDTADTKQAYFDGFSDTKGYVESGLADFIMLKAYGSTEDIALNFEKVVSWWYEIAEKSGAKCYVCHLNERIGSKSGWNEDQLLRQLTIMDEHFKNLGGSAFHSYESLRDNVLNTADTLKKYFADQINTQTLFEGLEMVTPNYTNFVTYDPTVKFMGTFDENFDVYFDGRKIELNERGNFLITKDLKVGGNSFTIEHKGKKINYYIERRVEVLKSVENVNNITVAGGTRITIGAIAYSGSSVSASINGQVINLKETASGEQIGEDSSYSEFVGYYTAPKGIVGKVQNLGNISFYGNYLGFEKYMTGGSITVEAAPEPTPPKEDIKVDIIPDQSTAGTGEVVGRIDPIIDDVPGEIVTYVKVLGNNTDVLSAETTGRVPTPEFSQMPANTIDYYKSYSDGYYITTSGKRYREDYVTTFDDTGLGYNALYVKAVGNVGGRSFITLSLDYRTSFNITTSQDFVEGYDGPFGVTNFNAQYIYITFDNVTSVTALPSFINCALFSAGEWEYVEQDGIPKFRMKLTLRESGVYSGVTATYDENKNLQLMFPVPTPTLSGKTIVISPGHGMNDEGKWDTGAIGQVTEAEINYAVAELIVDELESRGATVIRLNNDEVGRTNRERPRAATYYNADLFIELHSNAAASTDAHGTEAYYFTPWSQPLAEAVSENVANCLDRIYGDGTDSLRGDKYSYWSYTLEQGFPCILLEMGFVSNDRECLILANPDNQILIAEAISDGIEEYFMRSTLSY